MIQLSPYGKRVVLKFNLIGMWIAVLVSIRNFFVCYRQYSKTRGKIHLVNMAQVVVFCVHRFLYGIIPLFEVKTCAYFPLLVSLWHITYILFYVVMFMRLIILELNRYSRWIKGIGIFFIGLRFADWPYELAFSSIQHDYLSEVPGEDATCWAIWGTGVIILNFIADSLANLFLSGMFIRRLFIHIRKSKTLSNPNNELIERIARKSLLCFAFTFIVNLIMNLLKVTMFLGNESDAFTVYFELIESTLLIEALRNDSTMRAGENIMICESCNKELSHKNNNEDNYGQRLVIAFRGRDEEIHSPDIENNQTANVPPVEPAILLQNQQHYFPTSLTPRPPPFAGKGSAVSPFESSSSSAPKEVFTMKNMEKEQKVSSAPESISDCSQLDPPRK